MLGDHRRNKTEWELRLDAGRKGEQKCLGTEVGVRRAQQNYRASWIELSMENLWVGSGRA